MSKLTIIQISDLHFGEVRDDQGNASAVVEDEWEKLPFLDGFIGHFYPPLSGMAKFLREHRSVEPTHLVFTGDLVSWGAPDQFKMGDDYMSGTTKFGIHDQPPIGLQLGTWNDRAIVGNHDHWPGKYHHGTVPRPKICGKGRPERDTVIGSDPETKVISAPGIPPVRLMMIDSCADISPNGRGRFLARASFVSHVDQLREMIQYEDPSDDEIRVLLLHHSLDPDKPFRMVNHINQVSGAHQIDDDSKRALFDFIVDWDVSILLTGHMHTPNVVEHPIDSASGKRTVLEARCGTTGVRTELSGDGDSSRLVSSGRQNTFLMHQIVEEDDQLYWKTKTYFLIAGDFIPYTDLGAEEKGDLSALNLGGKLPLT